MSIIIIFLLQSFYISDSKQQINLTIYHKGK